MLLAPRFTLFRPASFEDCVVFARKKFESYFYNKTVQLLHNFPLDHKTNEGSKDSQILFNHLEALFWTSPKRPPTHIKFDWNDSMHRTFIISLASLYAEVWELPRHKDEAKIQEVQAV